MLRYVTWSTSAPISLDTGQVTANGEALPQVRNSARAARLGDTNALVATIQAAIAQSLAEVLYGMQSSAQQLTTWRDEIASAVLVSSNMKLATHGIALLDLTIVEIELTND